MTTIVNQYVGITHPLGDAIGNCEDDAEKLFCEAWKHTNCKEGIHAFDEVWAIEHHYLHCDVCGMEVHINKIVIPDGKDDEI